MYCITTVTSDTQTNRECHEWFEDDQNSRKPSKFAEIKFAFEVYDFKGDGKVDGFYIGDLIRACNINPTNKTIDAVGGQKEKGKKIVTLEDMYPLFKAAKESKDTGGIHDFVEILKLYDKNEDKTILHKDLFRLLTNLGNLRHFKAVKEWF